jgi:hypothetical protein
MEHYYIYDIDNNDEYFFSVDMMRAYVDIFKPKLESLKITDSLINAIMPKQILNAALNKTDKNEYQSIMNADYNTYPVFMIFPFKRKGSNSYYMFIGDGNHRAMKAYLDGVKEIPAYYFPHEITKKFEVDENDSFSVIISKFFERFRNQKQIKNYSKNYK